MIKEYLERRIWSKMETQDEWWIKGFICGVVLTAFIMWRLYN